MDYSLSPDKNNKIYAFLAYALYFFVNFLTLKPFPLVHSDEVWLAKLSSTYLSKGSIYVTEPFFNTFPRQAHTLKSLFHLLQSLFIALFGENIVGVRLISLIAGTLTLILLHRLLTTRIHNQLITLLLITILGTQIQFLYASHFARQEILLFLILSLCLTIDSISSITFSRKVMLIALIIGISIGIHPNAFIIASMMFALILTHYICKEISLKNLLTYFVILASIAAIYIALSLFNNPDFVKDYLAYGATLQVNASASGRLDNFIAFYIKLWRQISGTYYLPDIRIPLLLPLLLLVPTFFILIKEQKNKTLKMRLITWYLMIIFYNMALLIIGRFNPTSILFVLLPTFLLLTDLLYYAYKFWSPIITYAFIGLLLLGNLSISYDAFTLYQYNDFDDYNLRLEESLTKDSVILGNLSGGFAFSGHEFYDIRNLQYLGETSVLDYIQSNGINTIVYYESYDYIHRNPQWQILYGDDSNYYEALNSVIDTYGTLNSQFSDPYYGMRIIKYIGDYPWEIKIYSLDVDSD